jgi:hypothetical protein
MKYSLNYTNISSLVTTIIFWAVSPFIAISPGFGEDFQQNKMFTKTTQARLAVDHAWETYHHAALGGILASPRIQTELEMNLHKSRALLAEAYDAEDKRELTSVNQLTNQIMTITKQIIIESREPKK